MANRKLARKGRYGDTELRNVAGRKSHVNKKEANLIDLYGMIGERLVQMEGSGTRNPKTGLPEYHRWWQVQDTPGHQKEHKEEGGEKAEEARIEGAGDKFDRDAYMNAPDKDEYLKRIGIPEDKLEYFKSNINEAYLDDPETGEPGFLTRAKDVTLAGATETDTAAQAAFDIGERGVKESFRTGEEAYRIGGLDIAEGRRAAGAQYGLGMEQAGISAGRSLFDVKQQGDVAAARSGFARSGTVTATTERAQKGIFQDYTSQQKSLAEAKTSAMTGLGIQEQALESDWIGTQARYGEGGIAMAGLTEAQRAAGVGADITRTGAQLTYETGVSDIGQAGEEEFWKNLMNVEQYG